MLFFFEKKVVVEDSGKTEYRRTRTLTERSRGRRASKFAKTAFESTATNDFRSIFFSLCTETITEHNTGDERQRLIERRLFFVFTSSSSLKKL